MRLDIFLPALRKPKRDQQPRHRGLAYRAARRLLPAGLFSDPFTKRRGLARWFLRKLGPSWLFAPVRRVVQGACFVAFLWLFFYVCWPYHAHPPRVWKGWMPAEVDAQTGKSTLALEGPTPAGLTQGKRLHVVDEGAGEAGRLGP